MSPLLRSPLRRAVPTAPAGRAGRAASEIRGLRFFREVKSELGKVTWPSRDQARNLTVVVVVVSVAVGLFLGAIDWMFAKIVELLLRAV